MIASAANSKKTVRRVRTVFILMAVAVVSGVSGCTTVDLRTPPASSGSSTAPPVSNTSAPVQVPAPSAHANPSPAEPFSVTVPEPAQPDGPRLRAWVQDHNRLYKVAAPLMIANVDLCHNKARRILGFTAKTRYSYSLDFVLAAESELGLDDRLRVINVLPKSGAEKAGIREGDALVAINGKELPRGENAEREAAVILGAQTRGQRQADLVVSRDEQDNEELVITVPLTPACAFGIELADVDDVISVADGYRIAISRGMLRAVRSDTELAYVIAHEFAHNLVTTRPRQEVSAFIDQVRFISLAQREPASSDAIPAIPPEAEADKIALYMLERAGVPVDGYAELWRLVEPIAPENSKHGSIETRAAEIGRVINVIARKKAAGVPLLP